MSGDQIYLWAAPERIFSYAAWPHQVLWIL